MMSGARPGLMNAGALSDPTLDVTSTTSPSAIPSCSAVFGFSSTQLLHIAEVIGSGSSCSQGRCAVEPSRNAVDGYGRKWNGYWPASPSNIGSVYLADPALRASGADGWTAAAFGNSPHQPLWVCAVAHASSPPTGASTAFSISS